MEEVLCQREEEEKDVEEEEEEEKKRGYTEMMWLKKADEHGAQKVSERRRIQPKVRWALGMRGK